MSIQDKSVKKRKDDADTDNTKTKTKTKTKTDTDKSQKADKNKTKSMMVRLHLDIHTEHHDERPYDPSKPFKRRDDEVIILHSVCYSPKMIQLSDFLFAHLTYYFIADIIGIIFKYLFEIADTDRSFIEALRGCAYKTIHGCYTDMNGWGQCSANSYSVIRSLTIEEEKHRETDDDDELEEKDKLPFSLGFQPIKVIQHIEKSSIYRLALHDAHTLIRLDAETGVTVIVPTHTSVAFPLGTEIDVFQGGTGHVEFTPASGTVTINSMFGNRCIAVQNTTVSLKLSVISGINTTWYLVGNLT